MRAILAQVAAESRMRLRSTSTIFAVLGVFALSFLYLPDPATNRVSISWRDAGERMMSGIYDSTYIGAVIAMLSALFLTLIGFYLVSGSIRRDRERHVLEIVAATPLSRHEYILGKWLAHCAYLLIVASSSLVAGFVLFLRHGEGEFSLLQFLMPWLLTVPSAMAFTAGFAVLFDVTPLLRSRFGWVVWFFAWIYLFMFLPASLAGRLGPEQNPRPAIYDPAGLMAFETWVERTVPGVDVDGLSMGIIVVDEPITRVPIGEVRVGHILQPILLWNLLWITLLLLASSILFRFKPGRAPARLRKARTEEASQETSVRVEVSQWIPSGSRAQSALRAIAAEARLTWQAAGLLRWPFLLASLLTLLLPASSAYGMAAVTLLLFGPIISEVAARESIHGTGSLVLSSTSVPESIVAWKAGALALFTLLALAPLFLRALLMSPRQALIFFAGMAGTVLLAAGLGALTHGGKFFTALYVVAWYIATQKDAALDFTGWFVPDPSFRPALVWLAAGAAMMIPALILGRRSLRQ